MNKLNITVFFSGAVVMVFEMLGSRILGPYFGTSIFTWTNIIGVILFSLSLGYYYGGKKADKNSTEKDLSEVLLYGSIAIISVLIFKDIVLIAFNDLIGNTKISSLISSIFLFAPTSMLLGMVSPYALKLRIKDTKTAGSVMGNLSAISTIGSIAGTFIAGFFLIPFFGVDRILLVLVLIILTLALILKKERKIIIFIMVIMIYFILNWFINNSKTKELIDVDTAYNRIFIHEKEQKETGRKIRIMGVNNENHSAMYLDNQVELVNEYTKYYNLVKYFNPDFKKSLMIGGAGYSFPKYFLENYLEDKTIDVVEIDYKITELAKRYFKLKDDKRLKIFHEDGRVFINKTKNKYDVIFGDAFSSHYSIPFQLTTVEAVRKKYDILNSNGVVILNIISAIKGEKANFLKSELKTYQKVFPQVYIFTMSEENRRPEEEIQNLILVALKTNNSFDFKSDNVEINNLLKNLYTKKINTNIPILTDDYAPVDYYVNKNF